MILRRAFCLDDIFECDLNSEAFLNFEITVETVPIGLNFINHINQKFVLTHDCEGPGLRTTWSRTYLMKAANRLIRSSIALREFQLYQLKHACHLHMKKTY